MTHTAALTYGFFSKTPVDKLYNQNHPLYSKDNAEMVDKLSRHPLFFPLGLKWHYSVATDVLGHVVERVLGQKLGEFLSKQIFEPLEMEDTGFYIPHEKRRRFTSSYGPKQQLKERYSDSYLLEPNRIQSGGGGLVLRAQDYMNFCRILL